MGPQQRSKYYVYMVECKYGTYYTGWTDDIKKRIETHNNGKGAKYLRGRGPVKLVFIKKRTFKFSRKLNWQDTLNDSS